MGRHTEQDSLIVTRNWKIPHHRYWLLQQDVLALGSCCLHPLEVHGCWQGDVDSMHILILYHFLVAAISHGTFSSLDLPYVSICLLFRTAANGHNI